VVLKLWCGSARGDHVLITQREDGGARYAVMGFVAVTKFMRHTLLPITKVCEVAHEDAATGFIDRAALVVVFHAAIL